MADNSCSGCLQWTDQLILLPCICFSLHGCQMLHNRLNSWRLWRSIPLFHKQYLFVYHITVHEHAWMTLKMVLFIAFVLIKCFVCDISHHSCHKKICWSRRGWFHPVRFSLSHATTHAQVSVSSRPSWPASSPCSACRAEDSECARSVTSDIN